VKRHRVTQSRLEVKVTIDGHAFNGVGPADVVSKQFNEFLALVADIVAAKRATEELRTNEANQALD
jgi:hypothetical protein